MTLIQQFLAYLGEHLGDAYVWGARGQCLTDMSDPEKWIRNKETSSTNAERAIRYMQKAGKCPLYAFDCSGLICGFLMAKGLGLCYSREGTGGGTDILNRLIYKRFPQISIGAITFATDFAVIVFATCVFGKIESALYAIIAIFVSSKMIDIIVYGSYEGKMLLIFSDKSEEIAQKIMTAGKGVTFLSGKGAYSGDEKQVICCAVRKNDYVKVKRYVKEVDESAFMIITSAKEVLGKGFKEIN